MTAVDVAGSRRLTMASAAAELYLTLRYLVIVPRRQKIGEMIAKKGREQDG